MDAETAVLAGAFEADKDAEFRGCPLGGFGVAIDAGAVVVNFGQFR